MRGAPLSLFNSMGRQLGPFTPLSPGKVGLYSCGPTVYNYAHLGNLRAYVFTDTLRRVLRFKGYDVTHVMNITDVGHLTSDADEGEDKMEKAASAQKKSVWDIARHFTDAFLADMDALNILPPHQQPKATDHIDGMIAFNQRLTDNGHTYELADGLYFDTHTVPDYGKLAMLDVDGMQAGARVAVTEGKRHPTDFCLWRKSPTDSTRLMEWDSPWGVGAPGWHLECSQMSIEYLGAPFDIHTGGIDHRQVHHVNEIAQNMGYLGDGAPGAGTWMHNEFLVVGADKMSKSAGGFLRLLTLTEKGFHPLVYRYFCLQASYRKPLEFNWDAIAAAHNGLKRLYLRIEELLAQHGGAEISAKGDWQPRCDGPLKPRIEALDGAVSDDLNTPKVMANLNQLLADNSLSTDDALYLVALHDRVLGLNLLTTTAADLQPQRTSGPLSAEQVAILIAERLTARKDKDFARSDAIRDELNAAGVVIKDGPEGTTWEWQVG